MKRLLTIMLLFPLGAVAADAPAGKPAAAKPVASQVKPSRYITAGHDEYLAAMKRRLAINSKDRGPFGLYQVPGTAPALPTIRKRIKKTVTPFADVVQAISISAVFTAEQEFMVGSQIFRKGQVFSLLAGDDNISVQVAEVRSSSVAFKNLKSGEVVSKRLDLLPSGVTPNVGGGSLNVPGVTRDGGKNQAIRVDLNAPPSSP